MTTFDERLRQLVPHLERAEFDVHFPVYRAGDGNQAIEAWRVLHDAREALGHLPVILGPRSEVGMLEEVYGYNETSVDECLAEAEAMRADFDAVPDAPPSPSARELRDVAMADLSNRKAWNRYVEAEGIERRIRAFGELPEYEWPEFAMPSERNVTVAFDVLSRQPHDVVFVALIETTRPWEIFAHLKYGNWNACPPPARHVAWWRYWCERYDVTIVSASHDVIDAWPSSPPLERDDAMRLALQQYLYCHDIVDQGVGTVEQLAGTLRGGDGWYFWWD